MAWVVVRQNKKNPQKVKVIFNRSHQIKLHEGENAEQSAHLMAREMNKEYGENHRYTAVELN